MTRAKFSNVLSYNPYIDTTIQYEGDFKKTLRLLKSNGYDAIIDLQKSSLSRMITTLTSVKTFSFDKLNIKKWIYVNFKINLLPNKHIVDRYFEGIEELKVNNDGLGLDYFKKDEQLEITLNDPYDVLVLGAAHFTKRIPYLLSTKIVENSLCPIILLGGSDVEEEGLALEKLNPKVINMVGKTTLNQAAILINKAQKIWTGDTGLMHMAAALKRPITVLWGNTLPAFGMYPYYGVKSNLEYESKEVKGLNCRPCSKLGFDKCPQNHFSCMMQQKID